MQPLDHPYPGRPHRVYIALTNHCNRACPWCSTFSSPRGSTFISRKAFLAALPQAEPFELQLEGGEPTLHPEFSALVDLARGRPNLTRLVLCSNGVVLPRRPQALIGWLEALGQPLTVKLSVNHHLLERDPGLLRLAAALRRAAGELGGDRRVVFNVRLRRGVAGDDGAVREAVRAAGLERDANVFFLQRYGLAADQAGWEPPYLAGHDFRLVNPDGGDWGTDLVGRSEAMARLP